MKIKLLRLEIFAFELTHWSESKKEMNLKAGLIFNFFCIHLLKWLNGSEDTKICLYERTEAS